MKRIIAVFTLICMMMVTFVACSGASGNKETSSGNEGKQAAPAEKSEISGTVRVLLAGWALEDGIDPLTSIEFKGLNNFWKETFGVKYPKIKVQLNIVPWDSAQQKQQVDLASKNVDVLYTGSYVSQYYQAGLLRNIDDLLAKDTNYKPKEIFPEGVWNSSYNLLTFDKSKRYGLPAVMGQRYTIYDKKLFDDWGVEYLSEQPTVKEILEKSKKMTGKNPKTGKMNYGIWFNTAMPVDIFTFVAWSYAFKVDGGKGSPDDPKNIKWDLNNENMIKLFESFGELVKYTPKGFITGLGSEQFGTSENNVAIYLDYQGAKIIGQYMQDKKTNMIDRFQPCMGVGPQGESWVAVDPIVMAKNPKDLEAAWEVMKFLASAEMQEYHYKSFGWTPALKKADFIDPIDKYMKTALKVADKAHYTLIDEAVPFYTVEMVPLINKYEGDILAGKNVDVKNMLDNLQKKAEQWSAAQK